MRYLYYFQNGLRSGKWVRYNEAGIMTGFANYKAGKKDGTWVVWDDNGKKRFEMIYKNGEKTGIWSNWVKAERLSVPKTTVRSIKKIIYLNPAFSQGFCLV